MRTLHLDTAHLGVELSLMWFSQRQKLSKNATSSILATVWRELIHLEWFRELHHSSEVLFLETPIELADQLSRHWEVLIL